MVLSIANMTCSVRRVYSANIRVEGQKSRVTVAMYRGDGAEEVAICYYDMDVIVVRRNRDVVQYMAVW
jgi:hypothetical protein